MRDRCSECPWFVCDECCYNSDMAYMGIVPPCELSVIDEIERTDFLEKERI